MPIIRNTAHFGSFYGQSRAHPQNQVLLHRFVGLVAGGLGVPGPIGLGVEFADEGVVAVADDDAHVVKIGQHGGEVAVVVMGMVERNAVCL